MTNHGKSVLTLGAVTVPQGFVPGADALVSSLAPATSDTFDIILPTIKQGTFSGQISFITNDTNENPFNFNITGAITAKGNPTITVSVPDADAVESGNTSINIRRDPLHPLERRQQPTDSEFQPDRNGNLWTHRRLLAEGFHRRDTRRPRWSSPPTNRLRMFSWSPLTIRPLSPEETMGLTAIVGSGYTVGTPNSGSITIDDNEPVVTVTQTDADASETAGNPGMLRINLTEAPTVTPLSVRFTLSGSSAVHPGDYTMVLMNENGSEGAPLGGSPISIPVAAGIWISKSSRLRT